MMAPSAFAIMEGVVPLIATDPTVYTSLSRHERERIRQLSPPDEDVYTRFGLSMDEGIGLNAVPSRYQLFSAKMAYVHTMHLAIVGSPLRALSGTDIVATIVARFPNLAHPDGSPLAKVTVRINDIICCAQYD